MGCPPNHFCLEYYGTDSTGATHLRSRCEPYTQTGSSTGLAARYTSPEWKAFSLLVAGGLLWAGYRRGVKVEKNDLNDRIVLPFIGWSLLGPVGPGYLIGRLSTD